MTEQAPEEYLYKVLVVGDVGTGKTSLIRRFVHNHFSMHYKATIGVDFALKIIKWEDNTILRLQIWDIAGQERFGNMTRVYYKEAVGALVAFDITRPVTFEGVLKWKADIDAKVTVPPDNRPIPVVLLANKCDLKADESDTKLEKFARENGFAGCFETSAKENIKVDDAFSFLIKKILENDSKRQQRPESQALNLSEARVSPPSSSSSSNCCS
mmetsp:Transcript_8385/g.21168  ORF Transcript_8385/g.21168 Transcript_8385/m.21168 type:complete len:213 (+) Transcript_8385:114-752(+)|eukprot:CAMPEP_0177653376 /NCGR_PEP_ID=MMETSP0447-20121125/13703_1 /TAXON_ID=0 /ORGANISM="Stygamoeba regulata, Strain BSH-02190019" /LENGTH=212 /DNA_ID=CAMNT_0019156829 /DNA_START=102 /DNA_END=740 /DNA_ORIENTATION=-